MKVLSAPAVPGRAVERTAWFIRLRWYAAAGIVVFAVAGQSLLGLHFPLGLAPYLAVALCVALYNGVFLVLNRQAELAQRWSGRLTTVQVILDILALTILMHFGGGVENPFVSFYLFHGIIMAILLPWRSVVLHVLFASACLTGVAIAESIGKLEHYHIVGVCQMAHMPKWRFVTIALFAFITTLTVTAFLAASIAGRLHNRERELEKTNAALAEQDRIKSQYVMRVAHDLAEPASMITSCLKLVTQGLVGPVPPKTLDMVQRAEHKSEYLGHLIKDLLSLSAIKAERAVTTAEIDLHDVVNTVFEEVQLHAAEKNLTLEQDLPEDLPAIHGNLGAIHELFGNLVTNAVKYTLVNGRVAVCASNSGGEVVVTVEDDGVGIPADAIPHIFEEFYRADNVMAEAVEGTGLGLSIVEQILHTHGGKIWVQSDESKGTTFSFTLPVAKETHV